MNETKLLHASPPAIFLKLNVDEAFFSAKLQLPEDAPPEWCTAVTKVILALKVARHVDTGLPLSEPLWEEPDENIPAGLCGRFYDDA